MLEVCFFQHTPTFIIEPKKAALPQNMICGNAAFEYHPFISVFIT